jgi:transcription elongation factor Elf1
VTYLECPSSEDIDRLMICPTCSSALTILTIEPRHPASLECKACSSRHQLTVNPQGEPEWLLAES